MIVSKTINVGYRWTPCCSPFHLKIQKLWLRDKVLRAEIENINEKKEIQICCCWEKMFITITFLCCADLSPDLRLPCQIHLVRNVCIPAVQLSLLRHVFSKPATEGQTFLLCFCYVFSCMVYYPWIRLQIQPRERSHKTNFQQWNRDLEQIGGNHA